MEQFEDYYEKHHVPLVLSIAPFIARYLRNYIKPTSPMGTSDTQSSTCDVVTEIWFNNEEDLQKFRENWSAPEAQQKIVPDELNFLDRDSVKMFIVKERETLP